MDDLNKSKKLISVLISAVIIFIGVWSYLVYHARQLSALYADTRQTLAEEDAKENFVTITSRNLRETEIARTTLNKFFITVGNEASFLEKIENIATQLDLSVKVTKFERQDKNLVLDCTAQGNLKNLLRFTHLLELLPYNVGIEAVKFSISANFDKSNLWDGTYHLVIKSYLPTL